LEHEKMKPGKPSVTIVLTFIVCSILSLRVGILLFPAFPSVVLVPVLYFVLRRRWHASALFPFSDNPSISSIRLVLFLAGCTAYCAAWFQPVLTGAGPDSGSSFGVFFRQAAYYLRCCGYNGWFINRQLAPGHMFATFSMVAAWAIPGLVVIATAMLHLRRPSPTLRRVYLIAGLFSFLMPLWHWGPAGLLHAVAGLFAFLSVSKLEKPEMETGSNKAVLPIAASAAQADR
jgi:hypothetical protein